MLTIFGLELNDRSPITLLEFARLTSSTGTVFILTPILSNKWQVCDRSVYLDLKLDHKRIMLYDFDSNKIPIIIGIGLY